MNEYLNEKSREIERILGGKYVYCLDYERLEVVFAYRNSELDCYASTRVPFDKVLNYDDMTIWRIKQEIYNKCIEKYKEELKGDMFND